MKNSKKGFAIIPLVIILALLVIGGGVYVYENKKVEITPVVDNGTQQTNTQTPPVSNQQNPTNNKPVNAPTLGSKAKISWISNPPKLATVSAKKNNQTTTSVSAMCAPGTECQDTVVSQTDTPNYYACTLDTQCSFFTGFTGVQTGNVGITQSVPAQTNGSTPAPTQPPGGGTPTTNPTLPIAVNGSAGCFNKKELLQNARNVGGLKENNSITCECGIQPPTNSISGSPGAVDANTGEVTPGTISSVENQTGNSWSCMKPEIRPDIMTENFVFPQSVSVNSPFSISFDYKNVGVVGCLETYFQTDVTRTIAGQSEYLGGSGAHLLYATPLNPGEGSTFTFGSQLLPHFDIAGDYKLDLTMFCELPRETHIVNGLKEIHIKAN